MRQIEHSATVTCIEDGLGDSEWTYNNGRTKRITYEEGGTDREIFDENILELL